MMVFSQDFDGRVDVLPVSDPNIPSRAHRLTLASLALQLAAQTPPGTFNNAELIRQVLEAADFPNIDQVIPKKQSAQPADPVTDIMNATKGVPIAAFPGQDHEAHIQVKTAFLNDPTSGKSEALKQFAPIIAANIREHTMLRYKEQVEGVVAQTVPPEQYQMAVQQGMQDQIIAQAAAQVAQANQSLAGQGKPEEMLVQLDAERLRLEKEKMQLDAIKDASDIAIKNRSLDLKEDQQRMSALKDGIKLMSDKEEKELDREENRREMLLDLLADVAKSEASGG
jgi:hypothetical protein